MKREQIARNNAKAGELQAQARAAGLCCRPLLLLAALLPVCCCPQAAAGPEALPRSAAA